MLPKSDAADAKHALDIGAGYGGMFSLLSQHADDVYAYEPDAVASATLRGRGYTEVFPTLDAAFAHRYDLIGMFDVLEHVENDEDLLLQIREALKPNGTLVVTVPAYQWLWSEHDVENHHFRRYTLRGLRHVLQRAGLEVQSSSYWNTLLFPVAAAMRLAGRTGQEGLTLGRTLDAVLTRIVGLEVGAMRAGLRMPFGLSVVAVATRWQPMPETARQL
jgi:SAM-dependent methyltransferase